MSLRFALIAVVASLWSSHALAKCAESGSAARVGRSDVTCTPLNESTLIGLEGATRERVIEIMKVPGQPHKSGGEDVLHFLSAADSSGGVVNFAFRDGWVMRIFGVLETGQKFVWDPTSTGPGKGIHYYR